MIELSQLSSLGIGTSRAASLGSRLSTDHFKKIIETAADNRANLIDTANTYGSGDAERLIGKCLNGDRDAFFIMTKAGIPFVHTPGWLSPLNQIGKKLKSKAGAKRNYTSSYLIRNARQSNARLGVEAADAFLLHEPTWDELAGDDTWAGLEKVRTSGLARYTGVSTEDYRVVEAGIQSGQVQVVQTAVAWGDDSADAIIRLCKAHRIPVVANQVLRPFKARVDQFAKNKPAIQQMVGLENISLVQFLIAAVLVEKGADAVLFGTSDLNHLEHNMAALRYTASLPDHLSTLNQLLA